MDKKLKLTEDDYLIAENTIVWLRDKNDFSHGGMYLWRSSKHPNLDKRIIDKNLSISTINNFIINTMYEYA